MDTNRLLAATARSTFHARRVMGTGLAVLFDCDNAVRPEESDN